jgi:CxxC motif-containing protein (DUF1111 family)
MRAPSALLIALSLLPACGRGEHAPSPPQPSPALNVRDATGDAFSLPMPGLTPAHLARFFVGNSLFNQNWVAAPASVSERDGLGPLFNARSCSGCHFKDGRGRPPEPGQPLRSMILRLSVPGTCGPEPHPVYGDQLQTEGLPGVPVEARVEIRYEEHAGRYPDGERFSLRVPRYQLHDGAYGALAAELLLSPRVAPATIGLGLLEAVPETELLRREDPGDRDGDGISGRAQRVPGPTEQRPMIGRFGWKAETASVRAQVAGAFAADMGITSELFPHENHSAAQLAAAARPSGGTPELATATLNDVVSYMRGLAVPAARNLQGERGRECFERAGCAACHTPGLRTGEVADMPELARVEFAPFTDLLLHDLGEQLSDQRPSHAAAGSEWRTAPLWGIGLIAKVNGHQLLLHDGRARGVAEAILHHAGEAEQSKRAFMRLTRRERGELVAYVESL